MPIKKPMLNQDLLISVVEYLPFQTVYGMSCFLLRQIYAMENLRLTSKQAFADNKHLFLSLDESLLSEREINDHDEVNYGYINFDLAANFPACRKLALRVPSAHLMDSLSSSRFTQITSLTYDTGVGSDYYFNEKVSWLLYLPKLINLRHFALATYEGDVLLESIKVLTPAIEHISLASRYSLDFHLLFTEITEILINNVISLKSLKLDIADRTAPFAITPSHLTQLVKLKKKSRFLFSITLGGEFPDEVFGLGLDTFEKECKEITQVIPLEVYWTKIPTAVNLLSWPELTRLKIKLLAMQMSPYFFNYFTIDELLVFLKVIDDNLREYAAIQQISRERIEQFVSDRTLDKLQLFSQIKVREALLKLQNNCRGFISRVEMMLFLQTYSDCLTDARISSRDLLIFSCQNLIKFTFEQLKLILLVAPAPTELFYIFVKYTSILIFLIDEYNVSLERFPEGMFVFDNVIAFAARMSVQKMDALWRSLDRITDLLKYKDVLFSDILDLLYFQNFENIIFELRHLLQAGCEMSWIKTLHPDYISVERIIKLLFYQFCDFFYSDQLVEYMAKYTMKDIIIYAYDLYSGGHYAGRKIVDAFMTPAQAQYRLRQLGVEINPTELNNVMHNKGEVHGILGKAIERSLERLPTLFGNSTQIPLRLILMRVKWLALMLSNNLCTRLIALMCVQPIVGDSFLSVIHLRASLLPRRVSSGIIQDKADTMPGMRFCIFKKRKNACLVFMHNLHIIFRVN